VILRKIRHKLALVAVPVLALSALALPMTAEASVAAPAICSSPVHVHIVHFRLTDTETLTVLSNKCNVPVRADILCRYAFPRGPIHLFWEHTNKVIVHGGKSVMTCTAKGVTPRTIQRLGFDKFVPVKSLHNRKAWVRVPA
jgi:hypothetical protein